LLSELSKVLKKENE